jgi:hypothetical protein
LRFRGGDASDELYESLGYRYEASNGAARLTA